MTFFATAPAMLQTIGVDKSSLKVYSGKNSYMTGLPNYIYQSNSSSTSIFCGNGVNGCFMNGAIVAIKIHKTKVHFSGTFTAEFNI
jgi:hypothetical protein